MPASFNLTRLGLPVLLLLLCMWGFWNSARIGYSRLWLPLALVRRSPAAANRAVSASPNDPEAHFTSGLVQQNTGNLPAALREYERAAALRPRDYYFWLILGDAREQAGELEGSLAAYQEAVRLAPFYSQPRWQFGNFLFRVGRYTEAFAELRRAAESNPTLLPAVIDLAWGSSRQDAQMVEQIIQP